MLGKLLTIMLFSSVTAALEPAQHVVARFRDAQPVARLRPSAACRRGLAGNRADPRFRPFQRPLSVPGGFCTEHQGRPILPDAAVVGHNAFIHPSRSLGNGVESGTSLIPVTGIVLLLRAALEGHYRDAVQFLAPLPA